MTITIYILECENGKYYVGRSVHPKDRILSHFNRHGSEWTKKYKPIRIIATFVGDAFDEEKWTLKTMETYGIDNVRGGSYTTVVMNATDKAKAQQTIRSLTDKCYKCGSTGHFATDCNVVSNDDCSHLHIETMISDNKRNYCDSDNSDNDRFPEEENLPEYITKDSPLVSDGICTGLFARKRADIEKREALKTTERSPATEFEFGDRAIIVGLVHAAIHNGKFCRVTALYPETGRVRVMLDVGKIDVKPQNLQRVSADTRQPLSSTRCDRNHFSSVLSREPPAEKGMYPLPIGKHGCLNDLTFVIGGVQRSLEADEVTDLIKHYGGRVTSAVSNKTSYLLLGNNCGKLIIDAAAKRGTKIIDEQQLFDMIASYQQSTVTKTEEVEVEVEEIEFEGKTYYLGATGAVYETLKQIGSWDKDAKSIVLSPGEFKRRKANKTIEAFNVKLVAENQKLQQKLNAIKTLLHDN
jgi:hypothetical protein